MATGWMAWRVMAGPLILAAFLMLAWVPAGATPVDILSGMRLAASQLDEKDPEVAAALHEAEAAIAARSAAGPEASARSLVRQGRSGKPAVSLAYPAFGIDTVDEDIRLWVESIAATFERELTAGFGNSEDLEKYELSCSYEVSRPSADAVSVLFEIWTYTGGAHGNLDLITLNYSFITGQRLTLVDIFEDVDKALALMSATSRDVLMRRLGGGVGEQMILDGTEPDVNNFSSLSLDPDGVRIHFQPYQVAPWAAGAQSVSMPLEQLAPARPFKRLCHR